MKRLLLAAVVLLALSGCAEESSSGEAELSVPTQTTVMVDGYPLTCVAVIGYSNYGGGIDCDWDGWRASRGEAVYP